MGKEYANGAQCYVAGVNAEEGRAELRRHPDLRHGAGGKAGDRRNVSVIYVPPPFAAAAIDEAVDADLDLVICITEGIPVRDMVRTQVQHAGQRKTRLIGPNCPGVITPDEIKIGIMPGHIHQQGTDRRGLALRARSPMKLSASSRELGLGQSTCVGIGGDPVNGLKHIDVMKLFNDDPETEAVVMVGEIGGSDEEECARWIKANMKKPVVGFIAGRDRAAGKTHGPRGRDHFRRQRHRGGEARGDGRVRHQGHAQPGGDG